jgi:diacylglycerol O-acyltransferase / wax synthase
MQRLSPLDASFLHLERDVQQLNVGSVLIFEGPAPTYEELCDEIGAHLPRLPRYRQRIRHVPLELGRPLWVDDQHFRLREHVRHHHVRGRGTDRSLRTLAVQLISHPLDLDRPPWRIWLVTGLEGGRWATVNTNHHAMIDGISGADIMGVLLQTSPELPARAQTHATPSAETPADTTSPWTPAPEPSSAWLVATALGELAASPIRAARRLLSTLRPEEIRLNLSEAYGVARAGEQLARPEFGLTGHLGPKRRWAWARSDLATVKRIKNVHGGTVNDVVLAATAGGFRALLLSRGETVDGRTVRTMVPVSTRHTDEQGTLGNRVSAVFAELPVGIADPVERLHAVTAQLHSLKASGTALGVDALLGAAGYVPGSLYALALRTWAYLPQRMLSTVTTNVPGPRVPLYLLGRRMTDVYPYIPLAVDVRITIGIASYAGQLTWGATGDYDSVPDLQVLCDGIEESLAELSARTSAASTTPTSPATTNPPTATTTASTPEVQHA